MLRLIGGAAAALVALTLSGCCTPAVVGSLPVTRHAQETSNWCWAGSGQMVMDFLGHDTSQCTQANNRFGRNDCCGITLCPNPQAPTYDMNGNCTGCACPGWPEFQKYGFKFKRTSSAALSWDDLRKQLSNEKNCKKTPVAYSWGWTGGGGHMMVAKGYLTLNGTNYVVILDPWAPCHGDERIITYDAYVSSAGSYTHWDDFYDVTYSP
ncbi:MAG: papain-like cysteine protease family protein [Anaeromyxobacter sp.]